MKYLNIKKALAAWQELQPLSEKDRERLSRRFTVDFNYNSNHIEGNTLTYGQTEILLLFGKVIGEADVRCAGDGSKQCGTPYDDRRGESKRDSLDT